MLILHTVDLDNNIVCVQCMFVQRPAEMGVAERKVFVARLRLVVRLKVSHLTTNMQPLNPALCAVPPRASQRLLLLNIRQCNIAYILTFAWAVWGQVVHFRHAAALETSPL